MRIEDCILADSAERKLKAGREHDVTQAESDAYIRRVIAIPDVRAGKQAKASAA
jgi:hypothetical protein